MQEGQIANITKCDKTITEDDSSKNFIFADISITVKTLTSSETQEVYSKKTIAELKRQFSELTVLLY